jgi:signal transduction histidine kinase
VVSHLRTIVTHVRQTYDRPMAQTAPGQAGGGPPVPVGGVVTAPVATAEVLAAGSGGTAWLLARAASWYQALSPRRRDVVQDAGLGLALAALNVLSLLPYQSQLHPAWLAYLLVAGQCLPLAIRRVSPVAASIWCGAFRDAYDVLGFGYAPLPLGPAIAVATIADRSGRLFRWGAIVTTVGLITWSQTLPGHPQPYDDIVQYFIFGAAWAVGTLSRRRRSALAAAASRAEQAEASLDAAAASAAAAERVRIARELHDVVSHHVSLMAVQAEAVGALLPARPEAAATSADLIGSTARTAMTELRRLLGVLRFTDHEDPERAVLAPVPSMSRLGELVDVVRAAGLGVTCEVSGTVAALSPGVDLTAYRIVQEALTNALRHAPGGTASVRVRYEPASVAVEVTNTAPASSRSQVGAGPGHDRPRPARSGYGLAGIAERVASCGGSLTLGPTQIGGFTVAARLPLT